MAESDPEVKEEEEERPTKRLALFKSLKEWWSQLSLLATIVGAILAGILYIDDQLDEYEQRAVDITTLKTSNASLREEQSKINKRITDNVNVSRAQIIDEFNVRDAVDEGLRHDVRAVLNEMRARHGIIPLASGGEVRRRDMPRLIQEAQDEVDTTVLRPSVAHPTAEALSALDDL